MTTEPHRTGPRTWKSLLPSDPEIMRSLIERVLTMGDGKGADLRARARHELFIGSTLVSISSPGGGLRLYEVVPYDLSETGMGFLHGAFVHPETRCRIGIRADSSSNWIMIDGTIRRCRLVEGTVHDLGIEFTEAIDIRPFVGRCPSTSDEVTEHVGTVE